jgi:pimeloyl-ACP methyl ester carboxylesterase
MRLVKRLLTVGIAVYLGFGAYLFAFQRSLMYFPSPPVGAAAVEAIAVPSDGETLNLWRVNPGAADALIYFGGNAEAVVHNAADFADLAPQATTYLVDYRGYGASSGEPSEAALYRDALAVYDAVAGHHDEVAVIGRSLGSGVATYLATQRPISRLALITPYDSIENLAGNLYPLYPISLLLRDKYDSLARAGEIHVPTLFLIAGRDRIIPPAHARRLAAAMDPRYVVVRTIDASGHHDITATAAYRDAMQAFLAQREPASG